MTVYVELDDVLFFARAMGFHVRDAGLLGSAVSRPATTIYGSEVYPEFALKAAVLLESLTRNHGLLDGNKRTAWVSLQHFVRLNDLRLTLSHDQAFTLVTTVAAGATPLPESAALIAAHLVAS